MRLAVRNGHLCGRTEGSSGGARLWPAFGPVHSAARAARSTPSDGSACPGLSEPALPEQTERTPAPRGPAAAPAPHWAGF